MHLPLYHLLLHLCRNDLLAGIAIIIIVIIDTQVRNVVHKLAHNAKRTQVHNVEHILVHIIRASDRLAHSRNSISTPARTNFAITIIATTDFAINKRELDHNDDYILCQSAVVRSSIVVIATIEIRIGFYRPTSVQWQ